MVVSWCCGRLRSPNDVSKKNWAPNYVTGRNHVFPYFVNSTGNIKLLISVSDLRKHGFRFHDVSAPETTYHVSNAILLSRVATSRCAGLTHTSVFSFPSWRLFVPHIVTEGMLAFTKELKTRHEMVNFIYILPWFQGLALLVQKSRECSSVRTPLIFNHY